MLLKRINYLYITIILIIGYMHIGTGLYSDDFVYLNNVPNWTLSSLKILWSGPQYYLNIPTFLFYFVQIYLIDKNFIYKIDEDKFRKKRETDRITKKYRNSKQQELFKDVI